MNESQLRDFPPRADVATEIFRPLPVVPELPAEATNDGAKSICTRVLAAFSDALEESGLTSLEDLFLVDGANWRDTLALTYNLRTFAGRGAIARAFRELNLQRRCGVFETVPSSAKPVSAGPSLAWVECSFTFKTELPKAACAGRMMIIPEHGDDGSASWRIWVLSTWLVGFDDFPPDESRLKASSSIPSLSRAQSFEADVVIIGAGNSGLILASHLKALGVTYVLIEKNGKVGDNWALRHDNLRFHTGNGFCETPYLRYPDHVPVGLRRDDLADQMRRFAGAFHLGDDVLHSTTVQSTSFDPDRKIWSVVVSPSGKTIVCKHLVLCTGIASSAPEVPDIPGREIYTGISIHSNDFNNGKELVARGVKSVAVVGSANTGFDVMEDCYYTGLETTMIERSPTYIIPMSYLLHPSGFGIFDHEPLEVADPAMFTSPLAVGGQLMGMLHASLASQEPHRYARLAESGFQVLDSTQANLTICLTKRNGGHFVDIGTGVELLSSRKVGIRAGVSPVGFTPRGLQLSDGSTIDAHAIVWCTGYRDTDMRNVVADILGEGGAEIRDRMDATWDADAEGEMRGMWKRHAEVENLFVMGGGAGYQRWYSNVVALQIKAAVEGILPEAYRK